MIKKYRNPLRGLADNLKTANASTLQCGVGKKLCPGSVATRLPQVLHLVEQMRERFLSWRELDQYIHITRSTHLVALH